MALKPDTPSNQYLSCLEVQPLLRETHTHTISLEKCTDIRMGCPGAVAHEPKFTISNVLLHQEAPAPSRTFGVVFVYKLLAI